MHDREAIDSLPELSKTNGCAVRCSIHEASGGDFGRRVVLSVREVDK